MSSAPTDHECSCPLGAVDRRLADVHNLWHQAERSYFDPDAFRLAIQNAIQTLRTVTFVLQNQKAAIPDFDVWYASWQERLRSDALMRWLVDVRNKIEKQGDLEAQSFIRAEIIASYLDEGPAIEVPARLFDNIALLLRSIPGGVLGKHIMETGTLRVQRKWVENTLPDQELLDAVAHGYTSISRVVRDAHRQMGLPLPITHNQKSKEPIETTAINGRLPCMIAHEEPRRLFVSLRDGAVLQVRRETMKYDEARAEAAGKRYGVAPGEIGGREYASDEELARSYFDMARAVFLKDGTHLSFLFLLRDRRFIGMRTVAAADQQQKYLLYRKLAADALRHGADAVLTINEAWLSEPADLAPYQRPADSPSRKEALVLSIATNKGETMELLAFIERNGDTTTLGETHVLRDMAAFTMAPFFEAWGLQIPDAWVEAGESMARSMPRER